LALVVGRGVGTVVDADAADEAVGDAEVTVGLGVATGLAVEAAGDDPVGVGVAGVLPHAARRNPSRRDAAQRFAFTSHRRWCCGSSHR
jgi:hypothetical protein